MNSNTPPIAPAPFPLRLWVALGLTWVLAVFVFAFLPWLSFASEGAAPQMPLVVTQDMVMTGNDPLQVYWREDAIGSESDSLEAQVAAPESAWAFQAHTLFAHKPTEKVIWVKIPIQWTFQSSPVLLSLELPNLDRVDFWAKDASATQWVHRLEGDEQPHNLGVRLRHPHIELHPQKDSQTLVFVRLQTTSALQFPITLMSPEKYFEKEFRYKVAIGVFYGLSISIILFNFFVFFAFKRYFVMFYVMGCLFAIAFSFATEGLFDLGGVFENLRGSRFWVVFSVPSAFLFHGLFSWFFLEIPLAHKKMRLNLMGAIGLSAVVMALSFFDFYRFEYNSYLVIYCSFSFVISGWMVWKNGHRAALYFAIGWSAYCLTIIFDAMRAMGLIPWWAQITWAWKLGQSLELFFLMIGVHDRLHELQTQLKGKIQREKNNALKRESELKTKKIQEINHIIDVFDNHIKDPMSNISRALDSMTRIPLSSDTIIAVRAVETQVERIQEEVRALRRHQKSAAALESPQTPER